MTDYCEHFGDTPPVVAQSNGCEECLALGASWTELRICLTCGHVGCCEDSKHAHALQHFNATGHATIASFEAGQTWAWCYVHRRYFDPMPPGVPKRRAALTAWLARLAGR
jgi:uncharacterized UBP type Zn finger protein